jgi:hypothetical protein
MINKLYKYFVYISPLHLMSGIPKIGIKKILNNKIIFILLWIFCINNSCKIISTSNRHKIIKMDLKTNNKLISCDNDSSIIILKDDSSIYNFLMGKNIQPSKKYIIVLEKINKIYTKDGARP